MTTMFRALALVSIVFSALFAYSFSAHAETAFPATFAEFEKMSFEQMKGLPDVKWPASKKVESKDFAGKNETEVVLMRNSIYAQHGFRFSQKALANYFLGRSWYKPTEDLNFQKLSAVERTNVQAFMKHQASMNSGRGVASDTSYIENQIAYNLFSMGFCTYEVNGNPKAGLVVFDPVGKAQVFHSGASRSAFAPYAYEGYLSQDAMGAAGEMSLMIPAKWSIALFGDKRAEVHVEFSKDTLSMYRDQEGKLLIAPGKRKVLDISLTRNGDIYPFVKTKQCTMISVK